LTLAGLAAAALALPLLGQLRSFESALALFVLEVCAANMAVTPSLAYMAEAVSVSGSGSFGVAYGLYNFAWGVGILAGPALGGYVFERLGFARLTIVWAPAVFAFALLLARLQLSETPRRTGG
jgi:predicted MFS family arabinose efflux permease